MTSGSSKTPWFDSSLFPPRNLGTLPGVCLLVGWCHPIWKLGSAWKPTSPRAPHSDLGGPTQPGFNSSGLPSGFTFFPSPELRPPLVGGRWTEEAKVGGSLKILKIVLLCQENKNPTLKMTVLIKDKNHHANLRTYKDRSRGILLFKKCLECEQGCLSGIKRISLFLRDCVPRMFPFPKPL